MFAKRCVRKPSPKRPVKSKEFDRFCDAYHRNPMTRMAFAHSDNSIEGRRLSLYLRLAMAAPVAESEASPLPDELRQLLALQTEDGRWECLEEVLRLVDCEGCALQSDALPWEEATAWALAYIRQRCEWFEHTEAAFLRGSRSVDAALVHGAGRALRGEAPCTRLRHVRVGRADERLRLPAISAGAAQEHPIAVTAGYCGRGPVSEESKVRSTSSNACAVNVWCADATRPVPHCAGLSLALHAHTAAHGNKGIPRIGHTLGQTD